MLPFRNHHILCILDAYEKQKLPLDLLISRYFREHKALGSKDRAFIADTIYALMRWKGLLDHLCIEEKNWAERYRVYQSEAFRTAQEDMLLTGHMRVSFPEPLYQHLIRSHGEQMGHELCKISNHVAPTTVRINPLKTSREAMLERWKTLYNVSPCQYATNGIIFHKKIHFYSLPEFQKGYFEIQDEGSQLLSALVQPKPGEQVMDYCSGSGGKTLAFAPQMQGKGQIHLHDVRAHVLTEARQRLRRAGIQNAQFVLPNDAKLEKLKKKMDWVLVDAPCSGTGTMRRNPDMKWNFTEEMLQRLIGQQRHIFEKALSFLKPDGHIVYGTCSILREENENQLEHFMKTYKLEIEGEILRILPSHNGMDGFFGVVLKRQPCMKNH